MAPVVHRLEAAYVDKIDFVYLDTDDPAVKPLLDELPLIARPHFFLLDEEGKILKDWIGPLPQYQFTQVFDAVLQE
ncbi:MAG: hypothetical protein AAF702_14605 [Chloroflexota bacterium]